MARVADPPRRRSRRRDGTVTPDAPIVGGDVPDQARLRPPARVRTLDEFLCYLAWIEVEFGPVERPASVTTGDHFLL
jgi:hypothetical protein